MPNPLSGLSVLAAYAHPDDEGFGSGGSLAMLVSRGAKVTLVCATNGDVGEISDSSLATPENLWQVRQQELRRAMDVTGVADVRLLGYRDSGMDGTEDNNHPNALHQAPPDTAIAQYVDIIREVQPEIVITHDPTGGYGHPDHKAVWHHVTQAFNLAGDQSYVSPSGNGSEPWSARLLYYVCFPRSNFQRMWRKMLDSGITPPFAADAYDSLGTPDEEVTTVLNVSEFVDTKIESLSLHQTQIDPNGPFAQLPRDMMRELMATEFFTLALPEDAAKEADLLGKLA